MPKIGGGITSAIANYFNISNIIKQVSPLPRAGVGEAYLLPFSTKTSTSKELKNKNKSRNISGQNQRRLAAGPRRLGQLPAGEQPQQAAHRRSRHQEAAPRAQRRLQHLRQVLLHEEGPNHRRQRHRLGQAHRNPERAAQRAGAHRHRGQFVPERDHRRRGHGLDGRSRPQLRAPARFQNSKILRTIDF